MVLKFELVLDEPGLFRDMRIGCWRYVLDYETLEGEWYWEGVAAWTKKSYTTNLSPLLTKPKPSGSKKKRVA